MTNTSATHEASQILGITANHPVCGQLHFERVYQRLKPYYKLVSNGNGGGSLTDAKHALETIAYWREKGWISI